MTVISKKDKDVWKEYVSNFENYSFSSFKVDKEIQTLKKDLKLKNIDNTNRLKKNKKIRPDGILDLHGYKLETAKVKLKNYLKDAYERNVKNILVITGKGNNNLGVLKKEVPIWLNQKEMSHYSINFEVAPNELGGKGALLVRIKNKYKNLYKDL